MSGHTYEKPIRWRKDGPRWLRNPLWCSWNYIQRAGDEYPTLALPNWRIFTGRRLRITAIRYPHLWRWLPDELHVSGNYDDGRPFRTGHLSWLDCQIEWAWHPVPGTLANGERPSS